MNQLGGVSPKLVTLFASRSRDQVALNRAVRERLPKTTRLVGATSGSEIDRSGVRANTVVMSALTGDFDVGLGIGRGLSSDATAAGIEAMSRACSELGTRPSEINVRKHVGLVIDDAFQWKKEELLLGMMFDNQGVTLVGGGAADSEPEVENLDADPTKGSSLVHLDGEVASDAAIIALFRTDAPWGALRSHWFEPTGQRLVITRTDPSQRLALEIDGRPAAARYAELLDVPVEELEFGRPRGFSARPTALRVGREYFIRTPWKPLPDGSIAFANVLEEGTELEIMRPTDFVASTRRFFEEELPRRVENPTAALLFHCSGRWAVAKIEGKAEELSKTFAAAPPCAGFNVNFEIYCGFHINTTLTTLAFGARG